MAEDKSSEKEFVSKAYRPYEEVIAQAFEVFYSELLQIKIEDSKRGVSAIKPECWKNMMRYTRWGGRIAFEAKLYQLLKKMGASVYHNFYGAPEGIIFPILIPVSAFDPSIPSQVPSSMQGDETQHQPLESNKN